MRSGLSGAVPEHPVTFSSRKWREGFFMPSCEHVIRETSILARQWLRVSGPWH